MTQVICQFAGFQLDPATRQLLDSDRRSVALPPRAFDVLQLLVLRQGELLDKASLKKAVWRNVVVEDNNLDQCVSLLRRALRERGATQPFISTERGRGYRFVAKVDLLPASGRPATHDAEAMQLYTQARGLNVRPSPDNLLGALALLDLAIARDPHFLQARAERAHTRIVCLIFDIPVEAAVAKAEDEARQVLAIDPQLACAHYALAYVLIARGSWAAAVPHFDAACRLNDPPDARATRVFALTQSVGHLHTALDQALENHRRNPLRPLGLIALTVAHGLLQLDAQAFQYAEQAMQLGWPRTHSTIADYYFRMFTRAGRFPEAVEVMQNSFSPSMVNAGAAQTIEIVCAAMQDPSKRGAAIERLQRFVREVPANELGMVNRKRLLLWFTMLGALDEAFAFAHQSLDHFALSGTIGIVWITLWAPEMQPLRRDARFQGLVERLCLVDYWQLFGPPDGYELQDGLLVEVHQPQGNAAQASTLTHR